MNVKQWKQRQKAWRRFHKWEENQPTPSDEEVLEILGTLHDWILSRTKNYDIKDEIEDTVQNIKSLHQALKHVA